MIIPRPNITTIIGRIRADALSFMTNTDPWLRRSLLDVVLRVLAKVSDTLFAYLINLFAQCMWDSATGLYLQRWAGIFGVQVKGTQAATGPVSMAGVSGSVVIDQSVLLRADGAQFVVSGPIALVGGAATATVTAAVAGSAGNCAAGTVLTFASPSAGVGATATVGAGGIAGGEDLEGDPSLSARFLARVREEAQGGDADDYVNWALALPGVTRAWTFPLWMGAGTVGLCFVMDGRTDIIPLSADVEAVQAAIDPLVPLPATLIVFAPTPLPVNYILGVTPDSAQAAVAASLADLYAREGIPSGTILLSHVQAAIMTGTGATDFTLGSPVGNVVAPPGSMPMLGTIAWSE